MKDRSASSQNGGSHSTVHITPTDTVAVEQFGRLLEIVRILRGPGGCPWDLEQTPDTLKGFLLEESFETIDAINRNDSDHAAEELGDVMLIALMISYVYEQDGAFSVARVLKEISDKLIRRHPHVFSDAIAEDSARVKQQWDQIKTDVEGKTVKLSVLDAVRRTFPPLEAAFKLQKKAAKVGFDWVDYLPVIRKVREELAEIEAELAAPQGNKTHERVEAEIGDLLFSVVNLSRKLDIDPTLALNRANDSFRSRFAYIEAAMKAEDRTLSVDQVERMEALWAEAKSINGTGSPDSPLASD